MIALLGTDTDKAIATRLGIYPTTVGRIRRELGIPSFKRINISWTVEMDALVGTMTDGQVAKQLGLGRCTVRDRRYLLGIESWRDQHRVIPKGMDYQSREARGLYDARHRHLKKAVTDTLTLEEWQFAVAFFGGCCAYCGKYRFLGEDHLVPLSKGGPRTALNIIPACWECNNSKQATRADIWIRRKFEPVDSCRIINKVVAYLTLVQSRQDA